MRDISSVVYENTDSNVAKLCQATDILSYKWQPRILYLIGALQGASYSEIKTSLDGISSKMLSESLQELVDKSVVEKSEPVKESGIKIYEPTMKGRELLLILRLLIDWQDTYDEDQPELVMVKKPSAFSSPCEDIISNDFNLKKASKPEKARKICAESTDIVIIDQAMINEINDGLIEEIRCISPNVLISLLLSPPLPEGLSELPIDTLMLKPMDCSEFKTEIKYLLSRSGLTKDERKYLALQSKMATIRTLHGKSAEAKSVYSKCKDQIEEIALQKSRQKSLDNILPDG